MRSMTKIRAAGATLAAIAVVIALAVPGGAVPSDRVELPGSGPTFDTAPAEATPASERVEIAVLLGLEHRDEAQALLAEVSDPGGASYADYLTPDEFRDRFSPPQSDVDAVSTWLESQGFTIGDIPTNRLYVPAIATAAQVESAFAVELASYPTEGDRQTRGPVGTPSVPAEIAPAVDGVLGLTDRQARPMSIREAAPVPPAPAFINIVKPCSQYWGEKMATGLPKAFGKIQPVAPCGYVPEQMQGAYGVADAIEGGVDGTGVRVAIVDAFASPTIQEDLDTYSAKYGLPQETIEEFVVPPTPSMEDKIALQQGWWGEEHLDVCAVHTMAPGADIVYEGASSPSFLHIRQRFLDVVDNDRADMITNSYGDFGEQIPPDELLADNDAYLQAGIQGIGTYFSSGDDGDEKHNLGYRTVDWSAPSPYVTGVGGTSLGVGVLNDYLFETGWGTGYSQLRHGAWNPRPPGRFFYGGGGGTSRIFAQPDWQVGVVPENLSGWWGGANRVVPDIAMNADPTTGLVVGQTSTFPNGNVRYAETRYGGTSLSSPLFAGMMALADDQAGFSHGFANPALYNLDGTPAVHDVINPPRPVAAARVFLNNFVNKSAGKTWTLRSFNQTGTLHTRPGYDDVTGVGSPNGQEFLDAMTP